MNAVAEVFAFVSRASEVLSQPVGTELGADTPRFMLEQVPPVAAECRSQALDVLLWTRRLCSARAVHELLFGSNSACALADDIMSICVLTGSWLMLALADRGGGYAVTRDARPVAERLRRCAAMCNGYTAVLCLSIPHQASYSTTPVCHVFAAAHRKWAVRELHAPLLWPRSWPQAAGTTMLLQAGLYAIMGCMRDVRVRTQRTDAMFEPLAETVAVLQKYGIQVGSCTTEIL